MATFSIILGCLAFLFLSVAAQDGTRCTTQNECPAGMCCVHNPLSPPESMRRRFLVDQYIQHDHGFCRRARKFNESCWPLGHDGENPELYDFYCPCETGLECRGLVVHESNHQIIHRYPKCQSPESNLVDLGPTASGTECTSDTDCGSGMCCVSYPITDQRRQTGSSTKHGYCRHERQFNETCDIQDTLTHDFQCQCAAGLECRGLKVHVFHHQTVHETPVCQKI